MSQPKEPPISVRFPPTILALVDEFATKTGCTRHAAIVRLVGKGAGGDAGMVAAYFAEKSAEADHQPRIPPVASLPPEAVAELGKPAKVVTIPKSEPFKTRLKGEWSPAKGKAK